MDQAQTEHHFDFYKDEKMSRWLIFLEKRKILMGWYPQKCEFDKNIILQIKG